MTVRSSLSHALRAGSSWLIPAVAAAVFIVPMALRRDGLMPDWTNHLWLVWKQGRLIGQGGPSLFLSAVMPMGIFYPFYCFYSGTLYAAVGGAAWMLGDRPLVAYLLSYLAAFVMAYCGMTWLAHQCGLRGWQSQVPGLVMVTSAYYVTNAYGRGAWTEFVATSAIPLATAGGLWLLRADRWRPLPAAAFVLAVAAIPGSHNITFVWGGMFLSAVAVVAAWAFGLRPYGISPARVGAVAGLGVVAVCINGWFLVPGILHLDQTAFYHAARLYDPDVNAAFSRARMILNPLRSSAELPGHPMSGWMYTQAPVLPLGWALLAVASSWGRTTRAIRRLTLGLSIILGVLLVLLFRVDVLFRLPRLIQVIQYNYRLQTYVTLSVVGLVLCGLLAISRAPGRLRAAFQGSLVAVLAFGSCLYAWQIMTAVDVIPAEAEGWSLKHRGVALRYLDVQPQTWYDPGVYRDFTPPTTVVVSPDRRLTLDANLAGRSGLDAVVDPPAGPEPFVVNLAAPPWAIEVEGLTVAGHDASGYVVARRPPGQESGPLRVRVRVRGDGAVALGRRLSTTALGAAALIVVFSMRSRRREGRVTP